VSSAVVPVGWAVGLVVASFTVMLVGLAVGLAVAGALSAVLITGSGSGVGSAAGGGGGDLPLSPSLCPSIIIVAVLVGCQAVTALLLWLLVVVRVRHGYRNTRGDRVTGTTGMGTVLVFGTL